MIKVSGHWRQVFGIGAWHMECGGMPGNSCKICPKKMGRQTDQTGTATAGRRGRDVRRRADYHVDMRRVAASQEWVTHTHMQAHTHSHNRRWQRLKGSFCALFDQAACGSCPCAKALPLRGSCSETGKTTPYAAKGSKAINRGCWRRTNAKGRDREKKTTDVQITKSA